MYKIDCFLNKYYIYDRNFVYVVKMNSTIGREVSKYYKNGRIDKSKWDRLYSLDQKSIDVLGIDDYEMYLKKLKNNIVNNEEAIKKLKSSNTRKVNREKSGAIKEKEIYNTKRIDKKNNKNQKSDEIKKRFEYILLTAIITLSGIKVGSNLISNHKKPIDGYSNEKNIDDDSNETNVDDESIDENIDDESLDTELEDDDVYSYEYDDSYDYSISNNNEDDVSTFHYDVYTGASEESAKNAMQFIDLCKKYGKMYGEDYRLLAATLAQELNGVHKVEMNTPAIGAAQIELQPWLNAWVSAHNVEDNCRDRKCLIGSNVEENVTGEEFNKRPKSGDVIAEYGEESVINIEDKEGNIWARAMIDANYREQALKNGALDKIPESDFVPYTIARENKGASVWITLEFGEEWKAHLSATNNGDDGYVDKIFTYGSMISDYCGDNSPYVTKVYDIKNDKIVTFTLKAVPSYENSYDTAKTR